MKTNFGGRVVILNDLLCFVQNNLQTLGISSLQRLCLETYVLEEIKEAYNVFTSNIKSVDASVELDDPPSMWSDKEFVLGKIFDLFKSEAAVLLQFASSTCNLPRMGVYRDALSVTCLWDDLKELKQIIIEQNQHLSNKLNRFYEEFRNFKLSQEGLKATEDSEIENHIYSSDSIVPSPPSCKREEGNDLVRCYVTSHEDILHSGPPPPTAGVRVSPPVPPSPVMRKLKSPAKHLDPKKRCEYCGYTGTASDVTRHKRTHTGERPFACPTCSMAFSLRGNMVKHLARKHGTYLAKIPSKKGHRSVLPPKPRQTPTTPPSHRSAGDAAPIHQESTRNGSEDGIRSDPPGSVQAKEEPHADDFPIFPMASNVMTTDSINAMVTSNDIVMTSSDITKSLSEGTTSSISQLSTVGEASTSAVAMYNPMLRARVDTWVRVGSKKRHVCETCGYTGNSTDVTRHKRTHTGERPFACPVCDMRFTLRGNMVKHVSRKHDAYVVQ